MHAVADTFVQGYPAHEREAVRRALTGLGYVFARKKLRWEPDDLPLVEELEALAAKESAADLLSEVYATCKAESLLHHKGRPLPAASRAVVRMGAVKQRLEAALLDTQSLRSEHQVLHCVSLLRALKGYPDDQAVDWKSLKSACTEHHLPPSPDACVARDISPAFSSGGLGSTATKHPTRTPFAPPASRARHTSPTGMTSAAHAALHGFADAEESIYKILPQAARSRRTAVPSTSTSAGPAGGSAPPPPPDSRAGAIPDRRNIAVSANNEFAKALTGIDAEAAQPPPPQRGHALRTGSAPVVKRSRTAQGATQGALGARRAAASPSGRGGVEERGQGGVQQQHRRADRHGTPLFTPDAFKKKPRAAKERAVPPVGAWEPAAADTAAAAGGGFLFTPDAFAKEEVVRQRVHGAQQTERDAYISEAGRQAALHRRKWQEEARRLGASAEEGRQLSPPPARPRSPLPVTPSVTPTGSAGREGVAEAVGHDGRLQRYHRKIQSPAVAEGGASGVPGVPVIPTSQLKELVKNVLDQLGVSPVRVDRLGLMPPSLPPSLAAAVPVDHVGRAILTPQEGGAAARGGEACPDESSGSVAVAANVVLHEGVSADVWKSPKPTPELEPVVKADVRDVMVGGGVQEEAGGQETHMSSIIAHIEIEGGPAAGQEAAQDGAARLAEE